MPPIQTTPITTSPFLPTPELKNLSSNKQNKTNILWSSKLQQLEHTKHKIPLKKWPIQTHSDAKCHPINDLNTPQSKETKHFTYPDAKFNWKTTPKQKIKASKSYIAPFPNFMHSLGHRETKTPPRSNYAGRESKIWNSRILLRPPFQ